MGKIAKHKNLYDMGEKIGGSTKDRYSKGVKKENSSSCITNPIYFALDLCDGRIYASYYKNSNCRRIGLSRLRSPQILWKRQGRPFVEVGQIHNYESFRMLGVKTEYCASSDMIKNRDSSLKHEEIKLYEQYSMWLYTSQQQYLEKHQYDDNVKLSISDYCLREAERLLKAFPNDKKSPKKKNILLRIRQCARKKIAYEVIADYRTTFSYGDCVTVLTQDEVSSIFGVTNENNNITYEMLYTFVEAHEEELQEKARMMLEEKFGNFSQEMARLVASKREGTNWRNGKDATEEDFLELFCFRAVEFGETMSQKERIEHFNRTYDAFMDLANICGFSPADISLGGTLGICFGSRGHGRLRAHYEPQKNVINLTRRFGAGCLAHEWFHALDESLSTQALSALDSMRKHYPHVQCRFYFNKNQYQYNLKYIITEEFTQVCHRLDISIAVAALYYTLRNSNFYIESRRMDRRTRRRASTGIGGYWTQPTEMGARAFEYYIVEKLKEKGHINEYLAQIPEYKGTGIFPYPRQTNPESTSYEIMEHGRIINAFNSLFCTLVDDQTKALRIM